MRTWLAGADWIKEQGEVEVKEIFRIKKKEEKKKVFNPQMEGWKKRTDEEQALEEDWWRKCLLKNNTCSVTVKEGAEEDSDTVRNMLLYNSRALFP